MKLLVTGASGFLGVKLVNVLKKDFQLIATSRVGNNGIIGMDISNMGEVSSVISRIKPEVVVHNAALTDVDRCEIEKELAWKINVEGTRNVLDACKSVKAKIVYFSTDFVFDGSNPPYGEDDIPNPLSHYAKTKREAEILVEKSGLEFLLIRPEVLYGFNGDGSERSFVNWVYQSLEKGIPIRVVNDQFNTPTLIDDIAEALRILLKKKRIGVYHVAGPQRLSRYEMALRIANAFKFDKSLIKSIPSSQLRQKAPRPRDSSLKSGKIAGEGIKMHTFDEGMLVMKKQVEAGR